MTTNLQSSDAAPSVGKADPFLIVGNTLRERVIDQADKTARLMTDVTRESFLKDPPRREAVSMPLIRIGTTLEAALHVHPTVDAYDNTIHSAINLFRDLIHFYAEMDTLRLYQAATVDVPDLRRQLVHALWAYNSV